MKRNPDAENREVIPMNSIRIAFRDFLRPDTKEDASAAFRALSEQLAGLPGDSPVSVHFEPGRYDFYEEGAFERVCYISNHTQTRRKKIALLIENRRNVILNGNGARFLFHGTLIPVAFLRTENCVLKNLSIDYEFPQLHQLVIREVDELHDELVCELLPREEFRIENGCRLRFLHEHNPEYSLQSIMPFEENGRLCWNKADLSFHPERIVDLGSGRLRLLSCGLSGLRPGCRLVLRPALRPTPGIFLHHADRTEIEQVTVHYAFGMGLLAQMTEDITLRSFSVRRRSPDDPRFFTTQADATHFSGCKGRILSENGLYEGMADDAINVHGIYLRILEQRDRRTIRASYMHRETWGFDWGEKGNVVCFLRSRTMEYEPEKRRIASIRPVDSDTESGAKVFEIVFEQDLPPFAPGEPYGIENLTWTPEVLFRNNIIRNNRARGALFSTPKRVVCENNFFDHTHGSAILLCGDCNGWFETGACHEVFIRNNRFRNALTAMYQFTEAVISIYPEIPDLSAQKQFFHSNITITGNTFEIFDAQVLYAKSTEHLIFSDNTILHNHDFPPFHRNRFLFLLEKTADVRIVNNHFDVPFVPEKDICIRNGNPGAVTVS